MRRFIAEWRNFFTLEPGACEDEEIARHFPRNMLVNSLDLTFWLFGASFISVSTILPVFARHLTDSAIVIGLLPALTDFGGFFPQLFLAPAVERLKHKYPLVIRLAFLERAPYFAMPFAAIWLFKLSRPAAVLIFVLLIFWKSFASGIVATPWQEMIAKIIPLSHRGRFFAGSHLLGQLFGVAGSAIAAILLDRFPFPQNFAISFSVAAVSLLISFLFTCQAKEPQRPAASHTDGLNAAFARRLLNILRQNVNFRTYILTRWLSYFGSMAFGFVAVFSVEEFNLPDSAAAIYTGILYASSVVGYGVWGPLADRMGNKRVMQIAALIWISALVCVLLAILTRFELLFYLVFTLMGIGNAGGTQSDFNMAMEFGPEAERPTYIGLVRTVTGPALLIAPLLGGWIAQASSYTALFIVSLVFALAGLLMLSVLVREPRFKKSG